MKILVGCPHCIGGVVMALPALVWLHRAQPDWEIHALVTPLVVPIIEHEPAVAAFYSWDCAESDEIVDRLGAECYDAALMLCDDPRLVRVLKRAGIRRRHGPFGSTSQWLSLGPGRRRGGYGPGRHVRDDSMALVQRLAARPHEKDQAEAPLLHLSEAQRDFGRRFRREEAGGADVLAFLSPGGFPRPLRYPPARLAQVANELANLSGWRVFLTGSHVDRQAVEGMAPHLDGRVGVLVERFALRDFLGVLAAGDVMVAPSTGTLHLAAALGLASVGIFAPAPTINARRSGPRGRWTKTVLPPLDCPARHHCLLGRCPAYDCLETIAPVVVLNQAVELAAVRSRDLATQTRINRE